MDPRHLDSTVSDPVTARTSRAMVLVVALCFGVVLALFVVTLLRG